MRRFIPQENFLWNVIQRIGYTSQAPSEMWRLDYAIRCGISMTAVAIIALQSDSKKATTFDNSHPLGGGFAAYVTLITVDASLGANIYRSFGVLMGSILSTTICFIALKSIETFMLRYHFIPRAGLKNVTRLATSFSA